MSLNLSHDRIQAEFSKGTAVESKNESKSMRLTNILKEADVFTATSRNWYNFCI